ncbi:DUF1643 domain-containing protein [Clostridium sp. YIM B02551]|uniref:DUF1643 domain-containing protein n=1 Tax=Clostridium sp. YIM B02551 TaxID=2910679 RepID=UPI001EEB9FCC|nr:DUF1643 domain-containing protein [Clostridium sp. YIM B02551]
MNIELIERTIESKMHYVKSAKGNEYRYSLYRDWREDKSNPKDKKIIAIMLNPSKAKCVEGDNTITNITNYFSEDGFERLTVYNLFALMSTNPQELKNREILYEEKNIELIKEGLKDINSEDIILIGWGRIDGEAKYIREQANKVLRLLENHIENLRCFKDKKGIMPRHPVIIGKEWTLPHYEIKMYEL